jgi:hypothetical protein
MDVFIKAINPKANFAVMDRDYTNWERSNTDLMMQDEMAGLHYNKWIKQMLKGLTFTTIRGYTWMSTYEANQNKTSILPEAWKQYLTDRIYCQDFGVHFIIINVTNMIRGHAVA